MRARTRVSVVVFIARKLRPCPSYSRRRDRNNSVHWRSLYKGGGGRFAMMVTHGVGGALALCCCLFELIILSLSLWCVLRCAPVHSALVHNSIGRLSFVFLPSCQFMRTA